MDIKNLHIADDDFEQKVKALKQRLRLCMNGETSAQMAHRNISYAINYGASLPHIKALAQESHYTPDECRRLWRLNIRETMLIAAMLLPDSHATPDEMAQWAELIATPDMAEQASFFLFYRTNGIDSFVTTLLSSTNAYALATACYTIGRAMQKGLPVAQPTIGAAVAAATLKTSYTATEVRALSLMARQTIRQCPAHEAIAELTNHLRSNPSNSTQQLLFEIDNEMEMMQ